MAYEDDNDGPQFNRLLTGTKHVLGSTLKWAAIGAAVGGALFVGAAIILGISNPIGWLTTAALAVAGQLGFGGLTGAATLALTTGLTWGAVAGAIGGALSGFTGVSEAVDNEADRLQAREDNLRMRKESNAALAHQHDLQAIEVAKQARMMGLAPNVGFGLSGGGQER